MRKHSCTFVPTPEISFTDTSGKVGLLSTSSLLHTLLGHQSPKRERAFAQPHNHPFQVLPEPGPWGEEEGEELPVWVSPLSVP